VLVELVVLPRTLLVISFDHNTFGNILSVIVVTLIIKLIVNLYNLLLTMLMLPISLVFVYKSTIRNSFFFFWLEHGGGRVYFYVPF
jgi:hypothetical protein